MECNCVKILHRSPKETDRYYNPGDLIFDISKNELWILTRLAGETPYVNPIWFNISQSILVKPKDPIQELENDILNSKDLSSTETSALLIRLLNEIKILKGKR